MDPKEMQVEWQRLQYVRHTVAISWYPKMSSGVAGKTGLKCGHHSTAGDFSGPQEGSHVALLIFLVKTYFNSGFIKEISFI